MIVKIILKKFNKTILTVIFAMGSALSPSLTNAVLYLYKEVWLSDCPTDFKPLYLYITKSILMTSLYHKETFSEIYSNLKCFLFDQNKTVVVFILVFWTFSVAFVFSKFYAKSSHLKEVFKKECFFHQTDRKLHWSFW